MYFTLLTWHFYCWQTKVGRKNMFLFIFWALKKLHHPNIHISPHKYICMPWIFAAFWHLKIPVHVGICGIQTQPHKCWDFPFSHRDSIVIWMAMWNISGPHTGGWTRVFGSSMRWNDESGNYDECTTFPLAHHSLFVKILCILRSSACKHPAPAPANCNGKKWASALWGLLCMNAQMNWHAEHESYRGAPLETRANRRPCSLPHNDDSANGTLWRGTGPGGGLGGWGGGGGGGSLS